MFYRIHKGRALIEVLAPNLASVTAFRDLIGLKDWTITMLSGQPEAELIPLNGSGQPIMPLVMVRGGVATHWSSDCRILDFDNLLEDAEA